MSPILQAALGSILRWAFTFGAGWLVERGIWTREDAATYVAAAALAVLALGWSLWQKYRSHLTILAALDSPKGTTLDELKESRR